ncbi:hypothetical protein Clacol_000765 [Clathrus columnatus]|uniref:Uncharacterized protein n=1 Tax=Clathrus columnatus TaxID=1419009 RepID=A0AAV4ZX57_9AGAM|nr:hypothetical protein Clacol_000765 [Clathrus columnatus]
MNNRDLLNAIQKRLDSLLQTLPNHTTIPIALEHVDVLRKDFNKDICIALADKLVSLQAERAWNETGDDQRLLDELRLVSRAPNDGVNDFDIRIYMPTRKIPQIRHPDFPMELLDRINETYLLHTVAMDPSEVLPPGKSVLSVLSSRTRLNTSEPDSSKSLKQQVSDIMFKAFWDEALESLESSIAAVQLARLRLLYQDLHKAVETLLPPTIPIMYTLFYPLSPTSSPLRSASVHLKELLSVLWERCAPIRDEEFDRLINRLNVSNEELPRACVEVVRGILHMSDLMKNDMADFIIGTWTEQDALSWLRQQAIDRERTSILKMFTLSKVKELYQIWLSETDPEGSLVRRLIQALGSNQPVSPFPPSMNLLPPPLMYFAFDFFRIQNLLQALVISAALRSLAHRHLKENTNDWLGRIWALLESGIKHDFQSIPDDTIETRLINLEDEVVNVSGVKDDEEQSLREAVRRTLRVDDPVFKLLKKRLLDGIENRLSIQPSPSRVLDLLRSGKTNLLSLKEPEIVEEELVVKGFEEPILMSNIREVILSLRRNLDWFNETWKGTLIS